VAPPTLRMLTQHKTYINAPILHEGEHYRIRDDVNNSIVNTAKDQLTKIRDGGAPTTSNYTKSPVVDSINVELCEPIQINRDVYPNMHDQNPLQCMPTMHTQIGARELPNTAWRMDTCITENLKGNYLINNIVHKSSGDYE